jgi:hypothetical protein
MHPHRTAISALFNPSAAPSTIRDLVANAWALVRLRAHPSNSVRSLSLSTISTARGLGITRILQLHKN